MMVYKIVLNIIMFKQRPEPWKDPKIKIRVKTNEYFHQKEEMWNSLAHSSPKISQFYLRTQKNTDFPLPTQVKAEEIIKKPGSREQLKRRKLEREILQARSSQCISAYNNCDQKPIFSTFKDPAARPIICKAKTFDNYNELPENRLRLVVNEFILEKDTQALKYISKKIDEEVKEEELRSEWYKSNRARTLARMERQRAKNKIREDKAGVEKVKIDDEDEKKSQKPPESARLQRLSIAKGVKRGFPIDYIDSVGLLKAGVLQADKSMFPKSARNPQVKRTSSFPITAITDHTLNSNSSKLWDVKNIDEFLDFEEIKEQLEEMDKFDKRVKDMKERVGFPRIDLEKFQNKLL